MLDAAAPPSQNANADVRVGQLNATCAGATASPDYLSTSSAISSAKSGATAVLPYVPAGDAFWGRLDAAVWRQPFDWRNAACVALRGLEGMGGSVSGSGDGFTVTASCATDAYISNIRDPKVCGRQPGCMLGVASARGSRAARQQLPHAAGRPASWLAPDPARAAVGLRHRQRLHQLHHGRRQLPGPQRMLPVCDLEQQLVGRPLPRPDQDPVFHLGVRARG